MSTLLQPFEKQQYLNLETFRKSGVGVKTPVWFAQDGDILRIWTQSNAGKSKRIRNNAKVRIVPSKADGTPTGEWVDAQAQVLTDKAEIANTAHQFSRKYGFLYHAITFFGKLRKSEYVTILIRLG